jgi:penicillin V acylase-like amidase (Ntn superfamily)
VDVQGDRVVLNTAEGRAWPANVRRDPRVNLTVQNMENPYEFVSIKARLVEDTQEGADEHIDAMAMKYLGEETYPLRSEGEVRVILKFEADGVNHFGQ